MDKSGLVRSKTPPRKTRQYPRPETEIVGAKPSSRPLNENVVTKFLRPLYVIDVTRSTLNRHHRHPAVADTCRRPVMQDGRAGDRVEGATVNDDEAGSECSQRPLVVWFRRATESETGVTVIKTGRQPTEVMPPSPRVTDTAAVDPSQTSEPLFDHSIGGGQQRFGHG
jgi:hypothetical protein